MKDAEWVFEHQMNYFHGWTKLLEFDFNFFGKPIFIHFLIKYFDEFDWIITL